MLYLISVAVDVIDDEVAFRVEHLDFIDIKRVEALHGLVGGIGDELQPRMPRGIDTGGENRVVLHVHLLVFAVVGHESTAVLLAGVELEAIGVLLLIVVAVHALSIDLIAA